MRMPVIVAILVFLGIVWITAKRDRCELTEGMEWVNMECVTKIEPSS